MIKYLPFVLSLFLILLGFVNISGNISTIHWYNRTKVKPQDEKKYGRLIGIGTIIIGISIAISNLLLLVFKNETLLIAILPCFVVGFFIMLFAQFKYNKGIF